jgi:hypothetical protein
MTLGSEPASTTSEYSEVAYKCLCGFLSPIAHTGLALYSMDKVRSSPVPADLRDLHHKHQYHVLKLISEYLKNIYCHKFQILTQYITSMQMATQFNVVLLDARTTYSTQEKEQMHVKM